jgi:hypothetical protein
VGTISLAINLLCGRSEPFQNVLDERQGNFTPA